MPGGDILLLDSYCWSFVEIQNGLPCGVTKRWGDKGVRWFGWGSGRYYGTFFSLFM